MTINGTCVYPGTFDPVTNGHVDIISRAARVVNTLIVGVSVSLFQALTSVQEQTMSLVPKMLAVMLVTLLLIAPALQLLGDFTRRIFDQLVDFGLS